MADHGDIHWAEIEGPGEGDTTIAPCENCEYDTLLVCYWRDGESRWYCEVCASTSLSRATHRPAMVEDPELCKSIGWIANRILDEVRKISPAPGS